MNLCVIAQFYIREKRRSAKDTLLYLIFPLIGVAFIGWLLTLLDKYTLKVGITWIIIGFVYLFIRKKWLQAKTPIAVSQNIEKKKYVR